MKRKPLVVVATVAVLAVAACAPDKGTVVDKSYSPPHSEWVHGYYSSGTCISYRSKGGCASYISGRWVPGHYGYHPAAWSLKVRDGDDSGWQSVGSGLWDSCWVGQWYENDKCQGQPK